MKVFELAPPITDTPILAKDFQHLTLVRPMHLGKMVTEAIEGLRNDQLEIRPGLSKMLKLMSRIAPRFALSRLAKVGTA